MSDANKYFNSYIDIIIGTLHQYLNDVLQLKTQLKLSNDLISEKDEVINSLRNNVEKNNSIDRDIETYKNNSVDWENKFNAMKNKISHMDTLSKQLIDMKGIIIEKDSEMLELNTKLEKQRKTITDLESVINKRKKPAKKEKVNFLFTNAEINKTKLTDDF